ncbi:HypC/HybG/HupF family hydrogenase formation chaperone [Thiohalorhabdus sp.]|uniref:HypC/HybG/HupF family hydrogenase formation chaperone n=1 Tax=Thiohalorhabdus sp. TaxID=3094134 RepID=UPI002FC2BB93
MCLAVPGRVVEINDDDTALVDFSGANKRISLALVEDVAPEDYVLVHVGFALQRIDPDEAEKTLALIAEMESLSG